MNNGKYYSTGAGYGLRVDLKDRDRYFKKEWEKVILELDGEGKPILVNVNKPSFWGAAWGLACRELISKDIGIRLIKNKKAPWLKGCPPKMKMNQINNNRFKIKFIEK